MAYIDHRPEYFLKEMVMAIDRIGLVSAKARVISLTPDEYKIDLQKKNKPLGDQLADMVTRAFEVIKKNV